MQAHTHPPRACLPDHSQVLASLPPSSGIPGLHQEKPQLSQLKPNGQAQAGSCSQHCQAATLMLPRNIQALDPATQPQPAPRRLEHDRLGSQVHVACLKLKEQRGGVSDRFLTGG